MKRAFANIPEGQVHYRTEGSGEPILLLHQYPTSSHGFIDVIPIMAKGYRVIAMDTLGYGDSDNPPCEYEIEDYARSVVSFIDAWGIEKIGIVGHHTGASIAVEMAVSRPSLVDKLVLFGPASYESQVLKERPRDARFHPRIIKEDGSHIIDIWQFLNSVSPGSSKETLQTVFIDYITAGTGAHDGQQAVYAYDLEQRLPLIKSPTLLIYWEKDHFRNRQGVVESLIPRCRTTILEGAPWLTIENPNEFAQAILEFLGNPDV